MRPKTLWELAPGSQDVREPASEGQAEIVSHFLTNFNGIWNCFARHNCICFAQKLCCNVSHIYTKLSCVHIYFSLINMKMCCTRHNFTPCPRKLGSIVSHIDMKIRRVRHNFVFECEAISATQLRFSPQKLKPQPDLSLTFRSLVSCRPAWAPRAARASWGSGWEPETRSTGWCTPGTAGTTPASRTAPGGPTPTWPSTCWHPQRAPATAGSCTTTWVKFLFRRPEYLSSVLLASF